MILWLNSNLLMSKFLNFNIGKLNTESDVKNEQTQSCHTTTGLSQSTSKPVTAVMGLCTARGLMSTCPSRWIVGVLDLEEGGGG